MEKNIEYYMKLPYTLIVDVEQCNDGDCYVARLQEVPDLIGVGDTPEEAIKELNINKRLKFKTHLEMNIPIPEPTTYSGQFHIRVGPSIHKSLSKLAVSENISLNQYITNILAKAVGAAEQTPKGKRKN